MIYSSFRFTSMPNVMSNSSISAPRIGLSLYANLLDADTQTTSGSISKAPAISKPAEGSEEPKKPIIDASTLRFQPTKRPQFTQKSKPKSSFPRPAVLDNADPRNQSPQAAGVLTTSNVTRPVKTTLADWTGVGDEDAFYAGEKRQRGGRKKKKKKKNHNGRDEYLALQDWDDIYDPSRPNSYEEYKHSDEKIREMREWKDKLYFHRMARKASSDGSDEEDYREQTSTTFAPPNYNFAPPPMDSPHKASEHVDSDSYSPPPPSPPPNSIPPTLSTSLPEASISRAPVRYQLPPAPAEIPSSEAELEKALGEEPDEDESENLEDAPRSLRPGQKGFAMRLMSKYGWSKGKGLGAEESGIVNPLQVKLDKRKKKSDAEGGGFRDAGGRGKIIGGKKNTPAQDEKEGKFGPMSDVIVLKGMVDGMNLDEEVEGSGDGGLMQEIGDECGEKYGRVERVYVDRHGTSPQVFVKFTSQLSALRAVNALEGRIFNGNTISARFYDTDRFETGKYE